ncbi:lipocalin family protein [uncultured Fibrella sp.]|uniref:lipocalin family protein n=1 Tax=uncultured Fibrella sp. TaxID=1284596 RepID=UPI0035CA5C3B
MLHTRFITLLFGFALAISCKQTTTTDPTTAALTIPGTYKVTQFTGNDGATYDYIQLARDEKNTCFTDLTLTFRDNGTLTTANVPACNKAVLFPDLTKSYGNATWSVADNTLTINYQDVVLTPVASRQQWVATGSATTLLLSRTLNSVDVNTGKPIIVTYKMELVRQ